LGCSITNGNDDFFDLGGDSLAAVRVFAALESALGIRLTHADLSRARSLAAFAQLVEQAEPQGCRGEIAPDPSRTEAPLSLAQQWIWMGHRLSVGLPLYHEAFAVTVPAAINPTRLERAIVALVARYPILRTAFVGNSLANTRQVLWGEAPTMLRSVDLENLPQSHRDTHARELAEAVAAEPFTLSAPPLVRVLVVRLGECESRIYLIFHHLIADAETVYFHFLPDLRALYLGHSLSPLPSSLTTLDLACHEQDQMRNVHADSSLSGILSMLEGAVGPTLPGIGRYGQLSSGRGGFLPTSSNPAHVSKLKGLANREGATLHMAVVAAFAWAIRRAGGPEDLVLVLLSAGREHPATAHVAGCFVNPFLVRISLSGTVEPETVMRRVRNACVEAYVYRDVPALFVAKALGARRQHGLFSLAVVMEPELGRGLADWSVSQLEVQTGTSKFDLCLQVEELAGGLVSRLEYRADVVGVTTAERVLAAWHLAVQELGGEE
jgi:acyl carrier protein